MIENLKVAVIDGYIVKLRKWSQDDLKDYLVEVYDRDDILIYCRQSLFPKSYALRVYRKELDKLRGLK